MIATSVAKSEPVFLIMAHRSPTQLARLVGHLHRAFPCSRLVVHIDAKSDDRPFRDVCASAPAEFLARRTTVTLGTFSVVKAELLLARAALDRTFSHAVLLSESCYPVRTASQLRQHLANHPDTSFVTCDDVADQPWKTGRFTEYRISPALKRIGVRRGQHRVERLVNRVMRPRTPPVPIRTGSMWWALAAEATRHVVETTRDSRRMRRYFALSDVPDEMYVQSLVHASGFAVDRSLTYDRWGHPHNAHPDVLTRADLPNIPSRFFFARKFDLRVDADVFDVLDAALLPEIKPS